MASKKKHDKLHYDDVLIHVLGEFGKYQKICFAFLVLTAIPCGIATFSMVFTMAETDAWCNVPDDIRTHVCSPNSNQSQYECEYRLKNLTLPKEASEDQCGTSWRYSQCYRYDIHVNNITQDVFVSNRTIACDHGWMYDRSQYKSTVTQQFDLVCDRYYLNALIPSIQSVGYSIGSLGSGYLLDNFGRLRGFILAVILFEVFGTAIAFAPSYPVFAVLQFCLSVVGYSTYLGGFVLATELVGPSKRTMVGMVVPIFYGVGYMFLSLFAYYIRHWWMLQLAIILPNVLFLSYWCILPESPRWLLSMGRDKQAIDIIRKTARINKVTLPDGIFDGSWKPCLNDQQDQGQYNQEFMKEGKEHGLIDLFRLPNMRKKTLILAFTWLACNLVYFGISFSTSSLGGNEYINAFFSAAVEVPAYAIAIFTLESPLLGRRRSLFVTMSITGLACISAGLVPLCSNLVWLRITCAMIGKFAISSAFGISYVYGAELFPTPVRSLGIGLCSMLGYSGAIVAPQILLLRSMWYPLPSVIFGIMALLAGFAALPLPETRGKQLPETIEEGERFGKKPSRHIGNNNWYPGCGKIRQIHSGNGSDDYNAKLASTETFL